MPLFLYAIPLVIVEEKENTVKVCYNSEFYVYEFDKKYIERYL